MQHFHSIIFQDLKQLNWNSSTLQGTLKPCSLMKHQVTITKASFQGGERPSSLHHDARWMGQTVPLEASKSASASGVTATSITHTATQQQRSGGGVRGAQSTRAALCPSAVPPSERTRAQNKAPGRPRGVLAEGREHPRPGRPPDRRRHWAPGPPCHRGHPRTGRLGRGASESVHL